MEKLEIHLVKKEELRELSRLACAIWTEHYTPILGKAQVAYMVQNFQSEQAIRRQMDQENYRYYFFDWDGVHAGYLGIQPVQGKLYLSKLYVHKNYRNRGISSQAVSFVKKLCMQEGYREIFLTVNKNNSGSIEAYRRLGFSLLREQTVDIGGGFVMDDYVYECKIPEQIRQKG